MAPVIQSNANVKQEHQEKNRDHHRSSSRRQQERKSELVCRVKYCNNLPEIPFDPKFITYPFDSNRFVTYKQTSLEKNYKHDLLTEHDLGVTIDLINPDTYACPPSSTLGLSLHMEDERLIEDDSSQPQDSKRSRHHNKAVPWLKKTEYISTEFNRYGASSEKTETKVGYNVRKKMKEETLYMDRESQIKAINKTFEAAKRPIKEHPGKPNVYPVETFPVFPDFDLWKYPFAQVMFDADPAPSHMSAEMSQAMIRGVMDESGEQFVAYFLPTEETMQKRKVDELEGEEYKNGEDYEYRMAREYNWNVKNKASKGYEENYFFVFRDEGVVYNELETRVRLTKRRVKQGTPASNSKLVVRHRPPNEIEFQTEKIRRTQLEPPQEEEELPPIEISQVSSVPEEAEGEKKEDSQPAPSKPVDGAASDKSSSSSSSSSSDSDSSSSSSSSDSESDEDKSKSKSKKSTEAAAIFGSDSDSD